MTAFLRQVRTLRCIEAHHIRPAPNARGLIDRRWHRERSALSIIRPVAAARGACLRLGQRARGPTPYRGLEGGGAPAARSAHVYRCFYGADKGSRRCAAPLARGHNHRRGCHVPGGRHVSQKYLRIFRRRQNVSLPVL